MQTDKLPFAAVAARDLQGPARVHPRGHRLRGQGAAGDAARPLPGDRAGLRHGPPGLGHQQRGALLEQRGPLAGVRSRCARNTAAPRGCAAWLTDKVRVVDGDITEPNLGLSRRGGPGGGPGHRRGDQLVGQGHLQPAAGIGAANQRPGHEERHRLRQAHEASGAVAHQHLLRRWQPVGRGVGERGAGGVFPAPARAARHPLHRRAGDRRQRPDGRRGACPGGRRPGGGGAARARPGTPERAGARSRRRGLAEAGAGARAQGLGPPGVDRPRGGAGGQVGLAEHLHLHQEHGRPAGGPGDRHRAHHRPPGHRRELPELPVPRLERGLHHLGPAGLPGAEGAERAAGPGAADPGHRPGGSHRRRHDHDRRPGLRGAAAAGAPAVER